MSTAAITRSRFHPGATRPLMTAWTHKPAVSAAGWDATFMLRHRDEDPIPLLTLTGAISVVQVSTLRAEVARYFADATEVWQIVVTPTTAETQALRGEYAAGLDLTSATENVPLLDHHRIDFGEDIVR